MKDLKISKELLSEVLNYEVDVFLGINKNEIDYTCCRDENEGYIDISINLYEFAFKCKEWLLKNNIAFTLNYYKDNSVQFYCEKYHLDIESSSEIETIIKACNWILEEINDNKNI